MREESVTFYSQGDALSGLLRLPEDEVPTGGIVHGPGFLGLKDYSGYRRFHERFTAGGFAVLTFDYRGFGGSEGEPLLIPDRQVRDIRNAITYLQTREEVNRHLIGVFGTGGTGGGNAVYVAGVDDRVKCTVARNSIADGRMWLRGMRREYEFLELQNALEEDREARVLTGEGKLVDVRGENGLQIPTPERRQADKTDEVDPEIPSRLPIYCAETIMEFRPGDVVSEISPRAIMFVCVERDDTTPPDHAKGMYEKAGSPKKLLVQTETSHYESFDKNFDKVSAAAVDWYQRHLNHDRIQVREA